MFLILFQRRTFLNISWAAWMSSVFTKRRTIEWDEGITTATLGYQPFL